MAGERVMWLVWNPWSARSFRDESIEHAQQFAAINEGVDWPSLAALGWRCSQITVKETDGE